MWLVVLTAFVRLAVRALLHARQARVAPLLASWQLELLGASDSLRARVRVTA